MTRLAHRAPLRLVLAATLLLLAVPLALGSSGPVASASTTTTSGSARTVEATWHPWKVDGSYDADNQAWNGKVDTSKTPSVTVDRTTNLDDEVVNVSWKNFTPTSNQPNWANQDPGHPEPPLTHIDGQTTLYGVTVLECRGTHPTINPDPFFTPVQKVPAAKQQCYNADISSPVDAPFGQNNSVRAVTQLNGSGSIPMHVENSVTNDLLKCGPTQACSIVVVPNQGGRFNRSGSDADLASTAGCEDHTDDLFQAPDFPDIAGADSLNLADLSPCSWSKRIVVPLSFARLATNCPDVAPSFSAVGSPPLRRGLNQLIAGWCRGRNAVSFDYDFSNSESSARTQFLTSASSGLSSNTDVALTSQPADPSLAALRKFAYAPIANDAVSIPYEIDNVRTGQPMTDLRLTPRLIAKLLTQSYAPFFWNCQLSRDANGKPPVTCAKDVSKNPPSIFDDEEFQRLNFRGDHPDRSYFPSNGTTGSQQRQGSYFPTVAGGDSDLTYLLTQWIARDPGANSFLRGRADPYSGMRINPHYKVPGGVLYPTTSFNALDPGYTAPNVPYGGAKDGSDYRAIQGFQGSWNPVGSPSQVIATLARNRSTATSYGGTCPTADNGNCNLIAGDRSILVNFPKLAPEPNGTRGLTAVSDNTDAQSFGLPAAQVLTGQDTYVGPTRAALTKAAAALRPNADGVTQSLDFDTAPGNAYPLLLPVYAMVPTCGVSPVKATAIRSMLDHIVGSQSYGDAPGSLTGGLVKLTGVQLANTRKAAGQVSSKPCSAPRSGSDARASGGGGTGSGNGGGTPPTAGPTPAPVSPSNPAAPSTTPSPARAQNVGYRSSDDGGALALLPILLLLGGLILIGGPLAWWGAGTGPGQVAVAKARHLAREGAIDLRNLLPSRWRS